MDGTSPRPAVSRPGSRPAPDPTPDDDGSPPPDDLPACLSCRKRKSRCSRETPSCAQCIRLGCECLYVSKQKPGLKAGVVDTLSRRLDFLEHLFLDGAGNKKPHLAFLDLDIEQLRGQLPHSAESMAASRSLQTSQASQAAQGSPASPESLASPDSNQPRSTPRPRPRSRPRKRRRVTEDEPDRRDDTTQYLFLDDPPYNDNGSNSDADGRDRDDDSDSDSDHAWIPPLPALPLLTAIVEAHFQTVHHWVPILHPTRFRAALADPRERRRRAVLFHALLAMSIKYVDVGAFGLTSGQVARQIRLSRRAVQLNALDGLSFVNTQALIFLAFDYMGSGLTTKAWPIVAALTRMVVFLQLTVEPDIAAQRPPPLVQAAALFDGPRDWTEAEERRRIFWAVFLLDRISSISAGWQPSLTADDVHRRLPCSGGFWAREEPATTPCFTLWDRREGVDGTTAAASTPSPDYHATTTASPGVARDGATPSAAANPNKLGAVAYCIEATEHLSHVSAFFARQPPPVVSAVDTTDAASTAEDRAALHAWLTRFKELDLRLVHWKMRLPPQWSDWHVSLKIDPNLTLSHLSHLASMILLHQHVAYPPAHWTGLARPALFLPSACSAETCAQAAADMAAIAQKYLRYVGGLASSQFAFCLFVAARFVLVHARCGGGGRDALVAGVTTTSTTDNDLPPPFFALLESLDNISARWNGYCVPDESPSPSSRSAPPDLAAQYAARLRTLHQRSVSIRDDDTAAATAEDMVALLSTSSMEGIVKTRASTTSTSSSSRLSTLESTSATTPSAFSSASHLRSPSVIHGGGVEMAGIRQNPVPASVPVPVATATGMTHSIPRGPVGANISAVRVMPEATTNAFGMDMAVQQHPHALHALAHSSIHTQQPGIDEEDEFAAMSHLLLGNQFLDMDRVLIRNDTSFLLR